MLARRVGSVLPRSFFLATQLSLKVCRHPGYKGPVEVLGSAEAQQERVGF